MYLNQNTANISWFVHNLSTVVREISAPICLITTAAACFCPWTTVTFHFQFPRGKASGLICTWHKNTRLLFCQITICGSNKHDVEIWSVQITNRELLRSTSSEFREGNSPFHEQNQQYQYFINNPQTFLKTYKLSSCTCKCCYAEAALIWLLPRSAGGN